MKKKIIDLIDAIFSLQEKFLEKKYKYKGSKSFGGKMVKGHINSGVTAIFSLALEKNKEKINADVEKIAKENWDDLIKIFDISDKKGVKTYFLENADKILKPIGEEAGLIFEKRGFKGIYLNFITKGNFSLKSDIMFIFDKERLSPYTLLFAFYKWYSFDFCLPGFEEDVREKLKNIDNVTKKGNIEKLSYKEIMELKQGIARDKEAAEFTVNFITKMKTARTAFEKLKENDGEVNI